MFLETPRLYIRNLQDTDIQAFYEYRSNPAVCQFQGFSPYSEQDCRDFIQSQKEGVFGNAGEWAQMGIALKPDNQLIGDIGLKMEVYDTRVVEFGITLNPKAQQKGYALEALRAVLKELFFNKKIHRVVGITDTQNQACIRLFKQLGLRQEAHFKESFWNQNTWRDEYLFAILAKEFNFLRVLDNRK
jgi:[ribosomal protein S5]-alanine N-acetyltransferase